MSLSARPHPITTYDKTTNIYVFVAFCTDTSSLVARVIDIMARVRQLKREGLRAGITQAFAIARSHYVDIIDLEMMSLGFTPGYEAFELDEIEMAVAPLAWNLVDKVEDIVLPRRG